MPFPMQPPVRTEGRLRFRSPSPSWRRCSGGDREAPMAISGAPKPRVILLVGPTGVGKTQMALKMAGLFGGEIVSADSLQVYRGMDIGAAKPTPEERRCIPHHLLDV